VCEVDSYGRESCKSRRPEGVWLSLLCDKNGDVSRAKMARAGEKGGKPEKVASVGVKKESGYLYFVDKDGDVGRAKMARGRK
jgi:hypothetical protein